MFVRKLLRLQIQADRFLAKAAHKNDPLEKYRKTDDFLAFQDKTEKIIHDQIIWLKDNLSDLHVWGDDVLPQHTLDATIGDYIDKHMPSFKSQMDYDTVHTNFTSAFYASVAAQYKHIGVKLLRKAADDFDYSVDFELTNPQYLQALEDDVNYLLNTKSKSYDQTTKDRLITLVRDARLQLDSIDEIAGMLSDQVDGISSVRGFMIANTETAGAFGRANNAFMNENDIPMKEWIIAGPHNLDDECDDNAADGAIPVDQDFSSGDANEPAHTNCECYTQGVGLDLTTMSDDELDSLVLWDGS